jgi:hypothetical protein
VLLISPEPLSKQEVNVTILAAKHPQKNTFFILLIVSVFINRFIIAAKNLIETPLAG